MGILDKAKNTTQQVAGDVKERAGRAGDDPELAAEGRKDQAAGELKNAGEHAKDALSNLKDAVDH